MGFGGYSYRVTLRRIEGMEDVELSDKMLSQCHQRCANRYGEDNCYILQVVTG